MKTFLFLIVTLCTMNITAQHDEPHRPQIHFSPEFAKIRTPTPRLSRENRLKLHLIFDAASVEMFADDGANAMTDVFFPTEDSTNFSFFSEGGKTQISDAKIWNLKSVRRSDIAK